ncbi:Adenosine monophosphate-protein transferase SoFic [Candidatus Hepatincola sp. Pdp]
MNNSGEFKIFNKYKVFAPNLLSNLTLELTNDISIQLEKSALALAKVSKIHYLIPNVDLLLAKYQIKEALLSSQIEGTQSTLSEVLEYESSTQDKLNSSKDIKEVINYNHALQFGINKLPTLPLATRLIKSIHEILMEEVRGGEINKTPGEFRTSQNWIGGSSPSNSHFNPPLYQEVNSLMSDLDNFMNNSESKFPTLINAALIHYQFETIHPFLDGNGRVGRILIILYLVNKKMLDKPNLYISLYFKHNKLAYYESLMKVRTSGDYNQWLLFFLKGIEEVSEAIIRNAEKVNNLMASDNKKIKTITTRTNNYRKLYEYLLQFPYISNKNKMSVELEISKTLINKIIKKFEELGILHTDTNKKRYKQYYYKNYIDILVQE